MKKWFSRIILILIILSVLLYGFYVYRINTNDDENKEFQSTSNVINTGESEEEDSKSLENENKPNDMTIEGNEVNENKSPNSATEEGKDNTNTSEISNVANSETENNNVQGSINWYDSSEENESNFTQSKDDQVETFNSEEVETETSEYTKSSVDQNETESSISDEDKSTTSENYDDGTSGSKTEDTESEISETENSISETEALEVSGVEETTAAVDSSPKLDLYAGAALLMDANNDRILYEKNGYKVMPMASTTKIMTLIIALEKGNLDDVVTVSKYASTMPDVQLGIREGEQYKLGDLVYSLMLESHNDVAVAIAEHIGGSVEGFAAMMNEKARELGCENTNFVTPNGLDADGHVTTAADLAKIGSYAIKNKKFVEITNEPSWSFSELTKGRSFNVSNKDRFLYLMEGALGIKTGFTSKAGYCFVGALERDGKTFISVVLACGWPPNKSYKWHDTQILMNYGLKNYSIRQIADNNKTFAAIPVIDGQESEVSVYMEEQSIELLMREDETVKIEYDLPDTLIAPVELNKQVGFAKYYVDGELYQEVPIYTKNDVKAIDFNYCLKKILGLWMME